MNVFLVIIFLTPQFCLGALSIDRYKIETNHTVGTISLKHINNEKGMAVMNISAQNYLTITKVTMYFKINVILEKDGRAYPQEFMKSRIDLDKLLNGLHGNVFMKTFMDNILGDIQKLNITIPLPPVSILLFLLLF